MSSPRGTYRPLSPSRKWMCDLVALSRTIPIAALEHRLQLKPVILAREAMPNPRPSWVALFLKAFALVARNRPRLRQAYVGFPSPRIYEHPDNVAAITVEREWRGGKPHFFFILPPPLTNSVVEIDPLPRPPKTAPVRNPRPL